ncbi:MAG: hypothetical protein IKC17_06325, partial [Bacteroidales bacterium]|nr:hypothetical protein [Bacteroidales bacterium]
ITLDNGQVIDHTFTSVPVRENYRTNIVGNLISSTTDFNITIEEGFVDENGNSNPDNNYTFVSTPEELQEAINNGVDNIILEEDINLDGSLIFGVPPTSPIGRASATEVPSFVLDLGGNTITTNLQSEGRHYYAINNYANLTIVGEGAIYARGIQNFGTMTIDGDISITNIDTNGGAAIWNEGDITINGGTFISGEDGQIVEGSYGAALNTRSTGGNVIVNGGTFIAYSQLTYAIINEGEETIINNAIVKGRHGAVAGAESNDNTKIYGGSFELMENPDVSDHCTYCVSSIYAGQFTLGNNTDCGAQVFCESKIAEGYQAVLAADGKTYVVLPTAENYDIVITDPAQLNGEVLRDNDNILLQLSAGKHTIDLYMAASFDANLTIIGTKGTKVEFAELQVMMALVKNFTIKNCEILHMATKSWGHIVFGSGNKADGVYTIENCTFNGVGTQGIYINENISGATYNILNCTFNGDFGTEGAITIQTNKEVNHTVNVEGCEFNNIPAESHRIFLAPNGGLFYDLTLNTDLEATTAYELEMFLELGQENVVVANDIYSEAATIAPYGNKYGYKMDGGILDGNGHKLDIECYGDDYGIMTSGGTIKNLTIENGTRAVMIMYVKDDVILDNVRLGGEGVLYPINTGEEGDASQTAKLIVSNSTLAGWTSYSYISSASFTNVEFKQGTYYNNIYGRVLKPYVNTTLTNCSFIAHMNLDLSSLTEGHKIVIENCTVNGQLIAADVFTVPSCDNDYDTKLFTVDLPSWATNISDCIEVK